MDEKGGTKEKKRMSFERDPPTEIVRDAAIRLRKRLPSQIQYDDLYSVGLVALVKASRRFDASRGIDFRAYAKHRVYGAMLDELRRLDTATREQRRAIREGLESPESAPRLVEVSAAANVEDPCASPDETLEHRRDLRRMHEVADTLPKRLRVVFRLRFVECESLREVADRLGISVVRACQLAGEVVRRLRDGMGVPQPIKVVVPRKRRGSVLLDQPTLETAVPPPREMYA